MDAIKILENLKSAYKSVDDPEGKVVNFVGVYTLQWGKEQIPTKGFIELDEEEIGAIDVAIKAIKENVSFKIKIEKIKGII